jgi:hypothetical protein
VEYVVIGLESDRVVSCNGPLSDLDASQLADKSQKALPHIKFSIVQLKTEMSAYKALLSIVLQTDRD